MYGERDIKILLFPSLEFCTPDQNPDIKKELECAGSDEEYSYLRQIKDNNAFVFMDITQVKTNSAEKSWRYLQKYSFLQGKCIEGDFSKFLINHEGDVVGYVSPERDEKFALEGIHQNLEDYFARMKK